MATKYTHIAHTPAYEGHSTWRNADEYVVISEIDGAEDVHEYVTEEEFDDAMDDALSSDNRPNLQKGGAQQ